MVSTVPVLYLMAEIKKRRCIWLVYLNCRNVINIELSNLLTATVFIGLVEEEKIIQSFGHLECLNLFLSAVLPTSLYSVLLA